MEGNKKKEDTAEHDQPFMSILKLYHKKEEKPAAFNSPFILGAFKSRPAFIQTTVKTLDM